MPPFSMSTFIVYPGTLVPPDAVLGEFVLLGVPAREAAEQSRLGPGAVLRSHSVVYAGNQIGAGFQTGHGVLVRECNRIGDRVSVGSHTVIEHHVRIGNDVRIHSNVFIPEFSVLEDGAWIGPNAVLTNARYPRSPGAKAALRGPLVREGAVVGAASTLLPGVSIGRRALVGAGAVVVADVPDFMVVVGNPARIVNDVRDLPEYAPVPEGAP